MSENKELNNEELEKVTGGTRKVGEYTVYSLSDLGSIIKNSTVCIYAGNYAASNFTFKENGKVKNKEYVADLQKTKVTIEGLTSNNIYDFYSDGTCSLGILPKTLWIGPKNS